VGCAARPDAAGFEEELKAIADRHGLGWVVAEVDEVIREGKPQFKRPAGKLERDPEELVPAAITYERGILDVELYSDSERAELLASALRRTLNDITAAELATTELLFDSDLAESLAFVDEVGERPTLRIEERLGDAHDDADLKRLDAALVEVESILRA
jgi:hypothetical protein